MKLIEHMVLVNAEDQQERGLLVNTINGIIDVLSKEEAELIRSWEHMSPVEPDQENETAKKLFS